MILEIAQIDVKSSMEAEFEAGVAKAAPVFRRAKGCTGLALQRSIEKPVMPGGRARSCSCSLRQAKNGSYFVARKKRLPIVQDDQVAG